MHSDQYENYALFIVDGRLTCFLDKLKILQSTV